MHLKPITDRIIVKRDDLEEKTKSGIILVKGDREPAISGVIVSMGGKDTHEVKEGDRIMFSKHVGMTALVDDIEYLVMKEEDILGVLVE